MQEKQATINKSAMAIKVKLHELKLFPQCCKAPIISLENDLKAKVMFGTLL